MLVTVFADQHAISAKSRDVTLADLQTMALNTRAPVKAALPWLKLATFGNHRTVKGSLRNNGNIVTITGIEADYDQGRVSVAEAARLIRAAGIEALIYTSPSHLDDLPRWRVLCPVSHPLPGANRAELVARLNHVLGGVLSTESFTLSQAYYYGQTPDSLDPAAVITPGQPIDVLDLPARYPERRAAEPLALPPPAAGQTPDERTAQAAAAACGAFDGSSDAGRHHILLSATNALAPFVLSGHLDLDDAQEQLRDAMAASGRDANPGEVESAMSGALRHAQPYVPETGGTEFPALPDPAPEDAGPWRSMLQLTEDGNARANLLNACTALRCAPEWRGVFRLDTFANRVMLAARPPWHTGPFTPREVDDVTGLRVASWLQDAGLQVSLAVAQGAIAETADRNQFHPVRDYLDGLAWDGVPRIDTWLIDYFGADDTPLTRAVASKFLLSMVARVRRPGCKVDTVLILEGSQGRMKSSAFAALAGAWFIDHMPDLHDKAALEQLQGKWLVEFAELDKLHKAEAARVKAFISTATDRFRPAYGHYARDYPRQCVFVGTVNPGAVGYLQDETGNRRFWPVACPRRADVMALRGARDQIWAEASARHAANEPWWIDTHDLEDMQAEAAAERMAGDVWQDRIADYLADKPSVTTAEVLSHALAKPTERWSHADMTRVGRVMTTLGWHTRNLRVEGGRRERRYYPGTPTP